MVLELLLGFDCARNSTNSEDQASFKFLHAGGIKSNNSRRANLDYLLEGINIWAAEVVTGRKPKHPGQYAGPCDRLTG